MRRAWVRVAIASGALVVGLLPSSAASAQEEECKEVVEEVKEMSNYVGFQLSIDNLFRCEELP